MPKRIVIVSISVFLVSFLFFKNAVKSNGSSGAPPDGETEEEASGLTRPYWLANWQRPEGPAKVALQAGHLNSADLPEELAKLRANTGSSGGGKDEWEVNLTITELTAEILKQKGVEVEILPATIPPSYWADVFVAIHADGSTDRAKSGYKVAGPWRDFTNKANSLVSFIEKSYEAATGLEKDTNITRNMRGYYAFSWWRYDHAIHPMTTAVIIETGFLTNSSDQKLLINSPQIPARAIADGILNYLNSEGLLEQI